MARRPPPPDTGSSWTAGVACGLRAWARASPRARIKFTLTMFISTIIILHVLIYLFRLLHILYYTTSLVFLWWPFMETELPFRGFSTSAGNSYLLYIRDTLFLLYILSISLLVLHFYVYFLTPILFTWTNKYSNLCLNLLIHLYDLNSWVSWVSYARWCLAVFIHFYYFYFNLGIFIYFSQTRQADSC